MNSYAFYKYKCNSLALLLVILHSMRQFLLYSILLCMVLIHIPRSYIHNCTQVVHEHTQHDSDSHSGGHEGLYFEGVDCDLCSYYFHALDQPNYALIAVPVVSPVCILVKDPFAISIGSTQNIQLRGPPCLLHFS